MSRYVLRLTLAAAVVAGAACAAAPTAPRDARPPKAQLDDMPGDPTGQPCDSTTHVPTGYICVGGFVTPNV